MFVPDIFRKNSFDDFFSQAFLPMQTQANPMKTDVQETDSGYALEIELPGIRKEDVKAQLHDGCLTVSATTTQAHDQQDEKGEYLRRERFHGAYSRSFYVGKGITEQDIQAEFQDGVLHLSIPKKEATAPEKKYIPIQ